MTEAVKIFYPNGEHYTDVVVGKEGVKKIFWDKEFPGRLVVLSDDNIFTYTNLIVVEQKAYKQE